MMKYAYVTTNLLDLWDDPAFNSERISQILFGDALIVMSRRKGFARVKEADGYSGWVDERFLKEITPQQYNKSLKHINGVVSTGPAVVFGTGTTEKVPPFFLFYGTKLYLTSVRNVYAVAELPDGAPVHLKSQRIRLFDDHRTREVTGAMLVHEAKAFLGVPYLWGGISPAGFDCSGMMRAVFGAFGKYLPRDTKDQIKVGAEIDRHDVQAGDLLFFNRHVGLALSRERIIHSSVGGGGVRINSLSPSGNDYRPDLDRDFRTARRVL